MFEVVIIERGPARWEWQVCDSDEVQIMNGREKTRAEARYQLQTRLSKLEDAASPDENQIWQRVIGRSNEECEAKRRALIDVGRALDSDNFVFRIIVSPEAAKCEI